MKFVVKKMRLFKNSIVIISEQVRFLNAKHLSHHLQASEPSSLTDTLMCKMPYSFKCFYCDMLHETRKPFLRHTARLASSTSQLVWSAPCLGERGVLFHYHFWGGVLSHDHLWGDPIMHLMLPVCSPNTN